MIGLGLGIGNRRRRRGPTALRQFVNSASKGAWFWPGQPGSLWQTEAQTTPVTAVSQSVGRIDGNGASGAVAFSQSSAGLRPVFAAGGLVQFDGTDDILNGAGAILNIAQAANAITFIGRIKFGSLAAAQQIFVLSSNVGAARRFLFRVLSTGALQCSLRRLDSDTPLAYTTASGVVAANTTYSIIAVVDYVGNTASIYLNGGPDILAATLTLASSPGPTSNTTSLRARIGASSDAVPDEFFPGSIGMFALTNSIPTAAQRAAIFAELAL